MAALRMARYTSGKRMTCSFCSSSAYTKTGCCGLCFAWNSKSSGMVRVVSMPGLVKVVLLAPCTVCTAGL